MKPVYTAFVCLLFLSGVSSAALADDFTGVKRVDLRVASGNIVVTGVDGDSATVDVKKKRYDERCRLVLEQRGELLYVELETKSLFEARCEADFTLKVPKGVALKIKNGSGDISVESCAGSLALEIGNGNVKALGLRAPASVRAGSGHLSLAFDEVPADGKLEIQSGSGSAEVLFPKKARIRTSFKAGSGRLKNLLGESSDARFLVAMKTGSGSLTVK